MTWLARWWEWRRRRPFWEPESVVFDDHVVIDDLTGQWQSFVSKYALWMLDRPRWRDRRRT